MSTLYRTSLPLNVRAARITPRAVWRWAMKRRSIVAEVSACAVDSAGFKQFEELKTSLRVEWPRLHPTPEGV